MPTEITDSNGLAWKASIDFSQIPNDIKAIEKMMSELGIGSLDSDAISAPLIEAEKKLQSVLKQNAQADIQIRENVARAAVQLDNEVHANRERLNENWSATMDEQMKALADYQDELAKTGFGGAVTQTQALPVKQKQQATMGIDEDLVNVLDEAKQLYADLDVQTAEYIQELIELEMQLAKVRDTQKALDDSREKGTITVDDYTKSTQALAAQEKSIDESIRLINQRQKENDAITRSSTGSIEQKRAILKKLETQWIQLSEAEQKSTVGTTLKGEIEAIKIQLDKLNINPLKKVHEHTLMAHRELQTLITKMANNPGSPLFEGWRKRAVELSESVEKVQRDIKLATSDSAGVDALASGIRGLVGGFTAAAGAVSLFTGENEEAEKAIQQTMGALAVLNGVQEISRVMEKESALNVYLTSLMRKKDAAATAIQTAATTAQTAATTGATTATKGLTAAMLSNPATTLVVGITALVGAYLLFRRTSDGVRTSQELLADATKKVGERYAEQKAKLTPYIEALKDANLTEKQRVSIYENLKSIDERIVKGLDAKTISYQTLTNNVNKYLDSLRMQIRLESREEAIKESIKLEEQRKAEIDSLNEAIRLKKEEAKIESERKINTSIGGSTLGVTGAGGDAKGELNTLIKKRNELVKTFAAQVTISQELSDLSADDVKNQETVNNLIAGSVQWYEKLISAKQEEINKSTDPAKIRVMQDEIKAYQRQIDLLLGKTATTKEANKLENELNSILDKRQSILEDIAGLERHASQSGMLKDQSELDKINEKYDRQIIALKKVNEEIDKYNKRHPNSKQQLLGENELQRIELARNIEIQNARYQEDARSYIESLDAKKEAFEKFQEAISSGDDTLIQETKNLYRNSIQDFASYMDFLKSEALKVGASLLTNPFSNNIKTKTILLALNKEITDEKINQENRAKEAAIRNLQELVQRTTSIQQIRKAIERKYYEDIALLRQKYTGQELENRLKIREDQFKEENAAADRAAFEQTEIFKKMNQDILLFSRQKLQELKKYLEEYLKNTPNIPPLFKKQLQEFVDQIKESLKGVDNSNLGKLFSEISSNAQTIGGALDEMAGALDGVNEELAATIQAMSDIASLAANATNAIAQFASGNIVSGVAATIQTITSIFRMGARARESARRARAEVEAFNLQVLAGEMDINAQYRERERLQARLNKAKLEGLENEQDLLQKQKEAGEAQFNSILKQLQQQSYIVTATTERYGGVLGIGRQTRTRLIQQEIGNRSYDQLEKLFTEGRLDGKAKELFEMLQKIKQEGVDIDQLLAQNAQAFNELFTGTTSDSILDSIVDGFKSGLRSAEDFADSFEELMQNAVLNALKYQVLEEPLKEFYAQFAENAQSDDILTSAEIEQLRRNFDTIIGDAGRSFEELQKITNVNFDAVSATRGQGLKGSIKGITEQQAELLAGQFGGLRMQAAEVVRLNTLHLNALNDIRNNTGSTAINTEETVRQIAQSNSILKDIHLNGLKVK